jgi:hypothetical protein
MTAEKVRTYRGCNITRASRNSAGMRWESYCAGRFIRAETLAGIKAFIRYTLAPEPMVYTLAEIRNGTGFPRGVRFAVVAP